MPKLNGTISPASAHEQLKKDGLLIDVRSVSEFDDGHAAGAINLPLNGLGLNQLLNRFPDWKPELQPVFLLCEAGARATQAATRLQNDGLNNVVVIEGGTSAWRQAGLPTRRHSRLWSLERQTQIALGVILMMFLFKGALIHPAFYLLIGLIATGLILAGVTAKCTLTALLARMPWNQRSGSTA